MMTETEQLGELVPFDIKIRYCEDCKRDTVHINDECVCKYSNVHGGRYKIR